MDWQVTLDAEVTEEVTPDLLANLAEELALFDAAVAGNDSRASAVMTVTTGPEGTPVAALERAVQVFCRALETVKAAVTAWHVSEVVSTQEADARNDRPTIPALVGAGEAAAILQVSRQRVHQLLNAQRGFPPPVARPGAQPLWLESTIRAFGDAWDRRVGRPPAKTAAGKAAVSKRSGKALVMGKTTTRKSLARTATATAGKAAAGKAAAKTSSERSGARRKTG